eukprot:14002168-Alexandrium_andersonii.AAC.1
MSASLVGSEMCIRDRTNSVDRRSEARETAGDCRNLQCALSAAHACPCLLYTSDAADDMQCRS